MVSTSHFHLNLPTKWLHCIWLCRCGNISTLGGIFTSRYACTAFSPLYSYSMSRAELKCPVVRQKVGSGCLNVASVK